MYARVRSSLLCALALVGCERSLQPFDACYTTNDPEGPNDNTGGQLLWHCADDDHLRLHADGSYEVVFRHYSTFSMKTFVWEEVGHYAFDRIVTLRPSDGPVLHYASWIFTPLEGTAWLASTAIAHPDVCVLVVGREFPDIPLREPRRPLLWRAEGPLRLDECFPE